VRAAALADLVERAAGRQHRPEAVTKERTERDRAVRADRGKSEPARLEDAVDVDRAQTAVRAGSTVAQEDLRGIRLLDPCERSLGCDDLRPCSALAAPFELRPTVCEAIEEPALGADRFTGPCVPRFPNRVALGSELNGSAGDVEHGVVAGRVEPGSSECALNELDLAEGSRLSRRC